MEYTSNLYSGSSHKIPIIHCACIPHPTSHQVLKSSTWQKMKCIRLCKYEREISVNSLIGCARHNLQIKNQHPIQVQNTFSKESHYMMDMSGGLIKSIIADCKDRLLSCTLVALHSQMPVYQFHGSCTSSFLCTLVLLIIVAQEIISAPSQLLCRHCFMASINVLFLGEIVL